MIYCRYFNDLKCLMVSFSIKSFAGDVYEGDWQKNLKHGKGVLVYGNGNEIEGEWVRDKQIGKATYRFATGEVYRKRF